MDILKLKGLIKETPQNYEKEFNKQLELYKTLIKLPKKPVKEMCQVLDFLCGCSKFYTTDFSEVLVEHYKTETNDKLKQELFKSVLHQKKADKIEPKIFFEIVLTRNKKTTLKYLQLELLKDNINDKEELLDMFTKYLNEGTDFQKPVACFLIIYLFEVTKNDEVLENKLKEILIDCLFKETKIAKMVVLYFLDAADFEIDNEQKKETAVAKNKKAKRRKRIEDKINEKNQEQANFLSTVIDKHSTKSKIVESLNEKEAKDIARKLFDHVQNKMEEREFRILRLKIVGLLKVNFDLKIKIYNFLMKMVDLKNEDLKILMSIVIDSLEEQQAIECVKYVMNTFCPEYKDDDVIAFGLNLIKEICLKYEKVREEVRGMVDIYRTNKNKSVFNSYNHVMRAIRYGVADKESVDLVRRKRIKKNN